MGLGELSKRLEREIKASPAKAAVLAALGVVAMYFWMPVLMRPFKPSSPTTKQPEVAQPAAAPTSDVAAASAAGSMSTASWQEIDRWIASDHRMQPAKSDVLKRNPFGLSAEGTRVGSWTQSVATSVYQAGRMQLTNVRNLLKLREVSAVVDIAPQDAGLVLTSTVVGRRPVALISGSAYVEGSTVRGVGDHSTAQYKLLKIYPKSVVLSQHGLSYELKITNIDLASHD